ncbi:hypothetical protein GDO78_002991 [Eleutherodactylus coqui]|uniref:FAD-binding FR-type domain-containing protein n=1 Tax=Eleutherodactylus coqui TaxID=57060 RepID=A0A8J6EV20_ELECQ|nr:hypothetical protein GDO78_002991 [Eleutherodactylus coqui]
MALAAVSASCQVLRGTTGIFTSHSASLLSRAPALCACTLNRREMTSKRKTDHLERTANTFRQEIISPAKVCGMTNESSSVKRVRLAVESSEFTFKAGQWVDFFIPGVPKVGGFSICSSPGLLEREGALELAVKYNLHPPARWIHTQENILNLMHSFPGKIRCSFHVTQQISPVCPDLQQFITVGRISESHLANDVSRNHLCYICGPPPMIESMCKHLEDLHVPREQIYYEKWW